MVHAFVNLQVGEMGPKLVCPVGGLEARESRGLIPRPRLQTELYFGFCNALRSGLVEADAPCGMHCHLVLQRLEERPCLS